jgi:hypothetical protein
LFCSPVSRSALFSVAALSHCCCLFTGITVFVSGCFIESEFCRTAVEPFFTTLQWHCFTNVMLCTKLIIANFVSIQLQLVSSLPIRHSPHRFIQKNESCLTINIFK